MSEPLSDLAGRLLADPARVLRAEVRGNTVAFELSTPTGRAYTLVVPADPDRLQAACAPAVRQLLAAKEH